MNDPVKYNLKQATRFLQALDPDAKVFCFQQINDKENRALKARHLPIDKIDTLVPRSENEFGTFVTINEIEKGKPRTAENVTRVRTISIDQDTPTKNPRRWPLRPTLTVNSSPGKFQYHFCLVENGAPVDPYHAESLKRHIAKTHKGLDAGGVAGPNRVMRVPGFFHNKKDPYLVKLIGNPGPRYTIAQLDEAFGHTYEPPADVPSTGTGPKQTTLFSLDQHLDYLTKIRQVRENEYTVECPNAHTHTDPSDKKANFFRDGGRWTFKCHHDHCSHLSLQSIEQEMMAHGYVSSTLDTLGNQLEKLGSNDEFEEIWASRIPDEPEAPVAASGWFRSAEQIAQDRPVMDWAIENVVLRNTMNLLIGEYGKYKSFVALDLALHVATGKPWMGNPVKRGPVFMLIGEGEGLYSLRVQAWLRHHDVDPKGLPFYVSRVPANLSDKKVQKKMIAAMAEMVDNAEMIVVDTLHASSGGLDENSAQEIGAVFAELRRMRDSFQAAIWMVHHPGQKDQHRARGSYALTAGVDTEYLVTSVADRQVTLSCNKMKDAVMPRPIELRLQPVGLHTDDLGNVTGSLVVAQGFEGGPVEVMLAVHGLSQDRYAKILLDALLSLADKKGKIRLSEWRTLVQGVLQDTVSESGEPYAESAKAANQVFHRAAQRMEAAGMVKMGKTFAELEDKSVLALLEDGK